MTKRALLVGINYPGTVNALYGCVNDQLKYKELLLNNGYKEENILFLSDDYKGSHRPTFENIAKGFTWLLTSAKAKDFNKNVKDWPKLTATNLFFAYSGHGSHIADKSGTETDGRDEVIIPCDYRPMKDDYIKKNLCILVPSGVKLTAIMDCCHSGTIFDLPYKFFYSNHLKLTYNKKQEETKGNVIMLSSCLDNQTAAETWANRPYGLMSWILLTYLNKKNNPTYSDILKHMATIMKGQRCLLTMGRNQSINTSLSL
jgi:hypothetical protein